jgi:hypothetical protein
MDAAARQFLAEIGRRGGTRSRRTLTPEQARAMVAAREAKRQARREATENTHRQAEALRHAPWATASPALPGVELVTAGLADLAAGLESDEALLVSIAEPRLRLLGIPVPPPFPDPEERLFARLAGRHGDGAHGRYNALVRRLVSFARAAGPLMRPCAS